MRITQLAAVIGLTLSYAGIANSSDKGYFDTIQQQHQQKMSERLQALRSQASAGKNLIIKDGKRYLDVNGTLYRLNSDNYILFDMPKPVFLDETAMRNVFDFFSPEWELTWYDGGLVAVNTLFGNYDYGNGCLLEYIPSQAGLEASSRISMESASCNWTRPPQMSPQTLSLTEAGDTFVTLSWEKSEAADFYRLYRDGVLVGNGAAIKELTFTEQGLTPSSRYRYQVEACNQHGCASQKSAELLVETAQTPELLPAKPQPPVVVNAGSRTNVVNWQPVSGATHYQLTRNGTLIADNLTSVSYTNSRLEVNSQYEYAVLACNDRGCSEPSDGVTVTTTERDNLDIRVQHKDPNTPAVGLNVHTENSANVMMSVNVSYSSDNVYRYGREIYSSAHVDGGRFRAQVNSQPANGQLCTSDAPAYKRTGGKNAEAVIDCLTKATLVSSLPTELELTLAENFEYYLPRPSLYRAADNQPIVTSSFTFESLNEDVIAIDGQGKITLVGEGVATIRVHANPDYYQVDKPLEYKVKVAGQESPIRLQRIEIGQATLLSPGAPHQALSPKGKTLIRAYAYARDASYTTMPEMTLTIDANGQKLSKTMVCPSVAKVGSFTAPSYLLNEVCYSLIEGDEAANFITSGMVLTVSTQSGSTLISQPNVNRQGTINLKLVPGLNAQGVAKEPDVAAIDNTLKQVYPVANTRISVREPADLGSDLGTSLGRLDQIRKLETDGKTYFYGLVPGSCSGTVGLAYINHTSATGRDAGCSAYLRAIFVHELGHNLGLNHAPGCGPTSSEPFWSSGAWEGVSRAALSPAPLFEQVDNSVISPKDKRIHADSDLINYCFGGRFSQYNYQRIANYVNSKSWFSDQPTRSRAVQMSEPMLLISGEIVDGKVLLDPVIASNNPLAGGEESGSASSYSMLVNASDGVVMYSLSLLQRDHNDNHYFSLEIPASTQINALKFFDGEQELALEIKGQQEQASTLARTADNGPAISYQGSFVTWNNARYPWLTVVHTKVDGSRRTLALNATGGSLDMDQTQLAGGSLSFSLSDGINSIIHTEPLPEVSTPAPDAEAEQQTLPAYQVGTAYQAGDRVSNAGDNYECKPWPFSGWCGGSSSHYAPGTGSHWSDAWIKL